MRLHQLEVFCHVYEQGSVSAAAQALHLTQPAVSMHVRSLEQEVDVQLFARSGRRLTPTAAGEALYAYASAVRNTLAEAQQTMAEFRTGRRGRVRLGASTTGVIYHLPELLGGFRERHPRTEITLEADTTERVREAVAAGHHDVGLVWGPCHDERLTEERLLTARFTLILPPGHPLLARETLQAADLRGQPFVLASEHSSTRQFVVAQLQAAGIDPAVAMSLRTTEEVKQAVAAGLGLGVVAERAVRCELAAGVIATRGVAGLSLPRPIVLLTRELAGRAGAITALVRHLRAQAAALMN